MCSAGVRYTYDSLIVNDENEYKMALGEMGYVEGFENALLGKKQKQKQEKEVRVEAKAKAEPEVDDKEPTPILDEGF